MLYAYMCTIQFISIMFLCYAVVVLCCRKSPKHVHRKDHSTAPFGILFTTFGYSVIYFCFQGSGALTPLFHVWFYIQSSVFQFSMLTMLHRAFNSSFSDDMVTTMLCLYLLANIAHFSINLDFGRDNGNGGACGENAFRIIPFTMHICYYICFSAVLFPAAWSTRSVVK